jgi:hypothetical protein
MLRNLLGIGLVAALATTAVADLTVYTDRAAWEAALSAPIVTENFNAITPQVIGDGDTLDTGLVQLYRDGSPNGGDGALEIEPGSNFGNFDGTTFLSGETGAAPHEIVDVQFNSLRVIAFGADWVSPFSGDGIGLEVGSELILLDSISGFGSGFVGFISDSDVYDTISIVGNPDDVTFQELWSADNFSYAVPEPASLMLLVLAGLIRRR